MDFGADPSGPTDSLPAFQGATNAANAYSGVVYAPAGHYRLRGTLTLGGGPSEHLGTSLIGDGPLATILIYEGPAPGTAIVLDGLKLYRLENFALTGGGVRRAGTTGILATWSGAGIGTQTGSAKWENVTVATFATGIHLGQTPPAPDVATSEVSFNHLGLYQNGTGVYAENNNTLNIAFDYLEMNGNGVGIKADTANTIFAKSGHASGNGIDFSFSSFAGYSISNYRSEDSGLFAAIGQATAPIACLIQGCTIQVSAVGRVAIDCGKSHVSIIGNYIDGTIVTRGNDSGVTIIGNDFVNVTEPFTSLAGPNVAMHTRYTCLNNRVYTLPGQAYSWLPDEVGQLGPDGVSRVSAWKTGTGGGIGFNGAAASVPVLPLGSSNDTVIAALQTLGLVKQA